LSFRNQRDYDGSVPWRGSGEVLLSPPRPD
jgi:hypothetical protein